ncbi:MAG: hypothetical protein R6U26_00005, partial [Candidatus Undinarchaeales archaeon]
MAKKILGLMVFVLFLVLLVPGVFATCNYTGTGDWSITSSDPACSNSSETIIVNGSLIINGTLTFDDVTLNVTGNVSVLDNGNFTFTNGSNNFINDSFEPQFETLDGGYFYARNVTFDVNNTTMGYAMNFTSSTGTQIYDSTINHVRTNNSDPAGPALGVFFLGNSNQDAVKNTTIANAQNASLTVAIGANPNLNNLTLSNSPNCFMSSNTNAHLYNSTFSGCTENMVWLAQDGNLTTYGTYINNSNISITPGSASILKVIYRVQILAQTNGTNPNLVESADVNINWTDDLGNSGGLPNAYSTDSD